MLPQTGNLPMQFLFPLVICKASAHHKLYNRLYTVAFLENDVQTSCGWLEEAGTQHLSKPIIHNVRTFLQHFDLALACGTGGLYFETILAAQP
jgi:hypothetical protein